jgi:hypothetical protein
MPLFSKTLSLQEARHITATVICEMREQVAADATDAGFPLLEQSIRSVFVSSSNLRRKDVQLM